jgi:hypothetical protein
LNTLLLFEDAGDKVQCGNDLVSRQKRKQQKAADDTEATLGKEGVGFKYCRFEDIASL